MEEAKGLMMRDKTLNTEGDEATVVSHVIESRTIWMSCTESVRDDGEFLGVVLDSARR